MITSSEQLQVSEVLNAIPLKKASYHNDGCLEKDMKQQCRYKRKMKKAQMRAAMAEKALLVAINKLSLLEGKELDKVSADELRKLEAEQEANITRIRTARIKLELESERLCKICYESAALIAFTSCGHVLCCNTCSQKVLTCPVCKTRIDRAIRLFFS